MSAKSSANRYSSSPQIGVLGVVSILWRYLQEKTCEQFKSVWFIIAYLVFFQIVILDLPIVYSVSITLGIAIVVIGLTFFMEGLRLGLMPFGETLGAILPRNSKLPLILTFSFILGVGATFAEPAISVLKQAGSGVSPIEAPLLYSMLNDFSGQLVVSVGIGVGIAVALGILRFFFGWSLKIIIIPVVSILVALTGYAYLQPELRSIIGLAWDCGAVTTGPVTVPLVLALGIGVCRIIGDDDDGSAGFGIVTLASLFPILAVLLLSMGHFMLKDYYGAPNYKGSPIAAIQSAPSEGTETPVEVPAPEDTKVFSATEFKAYLETGQLDSDYQTRYQGGEIVFENGQIIHRNAEIVLEKINTQNVFSTLLDEQSKHPWDPSFNFARELFSAFIVAIQAIIPLCLFLFATLMIVLKERMRRADEIALGIAFAVIGMALFGLGLSLGLIPLGSQLGSNVPIAFAEIVPWGLNQTSDALFSNPLFGKAVAVLFAFFLGYGATLAEPALNALGETVEKATVGVFKKQLLMRTVAFGVGIGIACGVLQLSFASVELIYLLLPPYILLLFLSWISSEEFVNFAWDSAGVTTGPITVPLVLAMGLGIGANIPGVSDGFGILALASVGPIVTVLTVGLIVNRVNNTEDPLDSMNDE